MKTYDVNDYSFGKAIPRNEFIQLARKFNEHVFKCWRNGFKTKKIIETSDFDVNEEDVQICFQVIIDEWLSRINK